MSKRGWILVGSLFSVCLCLFVLSALFLATVLTNPDQRARLLINLQGDTRFVLVPDVPPDTKIDDGSLQNAKDIIRKRLNALGIASIVEIQDSRRLLVTSPGKLTAEGFQGIVSQRLLEFIDLGETPLEEGTIVETTGPNPENSCGVTSSIITVRAPLTETKIYQTVMTGDCVDSATFAFSQANAPYIAFTLKPKGMKIFADFTSGHVGTYLAIALDKKIISSPVINSAITGGSGIIEGRFIVQEAKTLAIQMNSGRLPFPLKITDVTTVR